MVFIPLVEFNRFRESIPQKLWNCSGVSWHLMLVYPFICVQFVANCRFLKLDLVSTSQSNFLISWFETVCLHVQAHLARRRCFLWTPDWSNRVMINCSQWGSYHQWLPKGWKMFNWFYSTPTHTHTHTQSEQRGKRSTVALPCARLILQK